MTNSNINLNLLKVKGAFVKELQGKTAAKRCLVIPIEDADLYEGKSGVYLSLAAWENGNLQDGKTHLVKQSFSAKVRESMTDEERKNAPIVGDVKPFATHTPAATNVSVEDDGDLPF